MKRGKRKIRADYSGLSRSVVCSWCGGKFYDRVRRPQVCMECDIRDRADSGWSADRIGRYLELPGWMVAEWLELGGAK